METTNEITCYGSKWINNIIEHKGLKPYKNTNHIGFIFLTNNENPIKVPIDDRRFRGIECNNLICNNVAMWDGYKWNNLANGLDGEVQSIGIDSYNNFYTNLW